MNPLLNGQPRLREPEPEPVAAPPAQLPDLAGPLRALVRGLAEVLGGAGLRAQFQFSVSARPPSDTPEASVGLAHLTRLDHYIVDRAPAEPVTMTRLAHLCDHDPGSYFRERVRRLVGLGLLVQDYRGYRLAPLPQATQPRRNP